jgi:hypothetical protein
MHTMCSAADTQRCEESRRGSACTAECCVFVSTTIRCCAYMLFWRDLSHNREDSWSCMECVCFLCCFEWQFLIILWCAALVLAALASAHVAAFAIPLSAASHCWHCMLSNSPAHAMASCAYLHTWLQHHVELVLLFHLNGDAPQVCQQLCISVSPRNNGWPQHVSSICACIDRLTRVLCCLDHSPTACLDACMSWCAVMGAAMAASCQRQLRGDLWRQRPDKNFVWLKLSHQCSVACTSYAQCTTAHVFRQH